MSKPDYELKIKARDSKYGTRVGAAWRTRSGDGINIKVDPGISIASLDGVDITLWPFREREDGERTPRRADGGGTGGRSGGYGGGGFPEDDFGDDVPFIHCGGER